MNIKNDLRLLSLITGLMTFFMLIPLSIALFAGETVAARAFGITVFISVSAALALYILSLSGSRDRHVGMKDGYLFVTLTWLTAAALGALPLFFSGEGISYPSAFFEIMSGFTTTGCSAIEDLEVLPKSLIFWRSLTNWLGGAGIVVLFVAIAPALGSGGTKFFSSETVGPSKDKITAKSRNNALIIWLTYLGLTLMLIALLFRFRLPLFDAVTVAFSTVSTAGFTPKNASIAAYMSPAVEIVITVFMFLAGVNFALYFRAVAGSVREVLRDEELRIYTGIVLVFSLLIAFSLYYSSQYKSFADCARYAFFHLISFMTTTGFSSADYRVWPLFSRLVLFLSMFIGGCAGSTGGGVKVVRLSLVLKSYVISIRKMVHPRGVFPLVYNRKSVDVKTFQLISTFLITYYCIYLVSALIISLVPGIDFETVLSAPILCLGNIGAGFGQTVNFFAYPAWSKFFLSFLMLVGRLELFTVLVLFSRSFWK